MRVRRTQEAQMQPAGGREIVGEPARRRLSRPSSSMRFTSRPLPKRAVIVKSFLVKACMLIPYAGGPR